MLSKLREAIRSGGDERVVFEILKTMDVADINKMPGFENPLFLAIENNNDLALLALFEYGVNIHLVLENGDTLLDHACKRIDSSKKAWRDYAKPALVLAFLGAKFKNENDKLAFSEYQYRHAFEKHFYSNLAIWQEIKSYIVGLFVLLAKDKFKNCANAFLSFRAPKKVSTMGSAESQSQKEDFEDLDSMPPNYLPNPSTDSYLSMKGQQNLVSGLNTAALGLNKGYSQPAESLPPILLKEGYDQIQKIEEKVMKMVKKEEEEELEWFSHQQKFPKPGELCINPDLSDKDGNTALHYICNMKEPNCLETALQFMLDLGANGNVKNNEDETPCKSAARNGIAKFALLPLAKKTGESLEEYYPKTIKPLPSLVEKQSKNQALINSAFQSIKKAHKSFKILAVKLSLPEWEDVCDQCKKANELQNLEKLYQEYKTELPNKFEDRVSIVTLKNNQIKNPL